jgi:hypothetical protein
MMEPVAKSVPEKMINSVDWDSLHSTNQAASDVPNLLRELIFAESENDAFKAENELSQE